MKFAWVALVAAVLALGCVPCSAGTSTPHLISFQGRALDSAGQPLGTGDVAVRIYDAAAGGVLVYDSGIDFTGEVQDGLFSVVLGSVTPLSLDNTRQYFLEVDVNGQEVVGDAAAGRQPFYPGGGSHERQDLEDRLTILESVVFLTCSPGEFDLNGNPADGCEFLLDAGGIYVSIDSPAAVDDGGCGFGPEGTGNYPCRSVNFGIMRATASGRHTVYVADGYYDESVTLENGVDLKGGYRPGTWERNVSSSATMLAGTTGPGAPKTLIADGLAQPTTVEGFLVLGRNGGPGASSCAVWVRDCSGLSLLNLRVHAGDGGPGLAGSDGISGGDGTSGGGSSGQPDSAYDAFDTGQIDCTSYFDRQYANGGVFTVGLVDLSGGAGGGNFCAPIYDTSTSAGDGAAGMSGPGALGGPGGAGGLGGADSSYDGAVCYPAAASRDGSGGGSGGDGGNGSGGAGATIPTGVIVAGEWIAQMGSSGENAGHGGGGGGGGAGGGAEGSGSATDQLGAHGGGGGAGGAGGAGGGGGGGGGGSFGIFVYGGSAPTIQNCRIDLGRGGSGGRGGMGGLGGAGGGGGAGGTAASLLCPGPAGAGGPGGRGGNGGGGGGGAGGSAYGVYLSNASGAPPYASLNTFAGGAAGSGGAGGGSPGNPGTDGVAGDVAETGVN
ncbi:MAG: hypothetical protein R6X25_00695 [Candidatus Krumholzibacteriia bacterium]